MLYYTERRVHRSCIMYIIILYIRCVPRGLFAVFRSQQTTAPERAKKKKTPPRRQRTRTLKVFFSFSPPFFFSMSLEGRRAPAHYTHSPNAVVSVREEAGIAPMAYTPISLPWTRGVCTRKIAPSIHPKHCRHSRHRQETVFTYDIMLYTRI